MNFAPHRKRRQAAALLLAAAPALLAAGTLLAGASPALAGARQTAAQTPPVGEPPADDTSGEGGPTRGRRVLHLIDQETLEAAAEGKKIRNIRIVTQNVFDPKRRGENAWLFRLANRLHITTRPEVVRRQLLFAPGDTLSPEAVRETERLLRASTFLYDASIRPIAEDANNVDLEVVTRDVWTLSGGINYHRAGGTNSTDFDVEDENVFGTGKDITLSRQADVDRITRLVRYRDPSLFGTRGTLEVDLADNSDGNSELFDLERPFYALDTRWAAGINLQHVDQIDPLYQGGDVIDRFRQHRDFLEAYGGMSPGLFDGATQRFRLGFTYDRNSFLAAPGYSMPSAAANRTLSYPWIGYEYVEDGFVTLHDFDRIHRTEDLNLGRVVTARLGFSSPAFGADRNRLILLGTLTDGWVYGPRQILLLTGSTSGRVGDGGLENAILSGAVRYYLRTVFNGLFVARASADLADRLDFENQLLLGGDNGLRGYPLRYQAGDRRFLFTVEQRFYGEREYFHLFHLGAAAFFDAGRAWFVEAPPSYLPAEPAALHQLLKDVGVGLRLGSSRSSSGSVIHLDLAFPLDRTNSIKAIQYLVTTSQTF